MTDRKPTLGACLTPEMLAEYLDGRANPQASREQVEAHLADCEDCYELFSESVKMNRALSVTDVDVVLQPATERRSRSSRRLAVGGGVLATAAAVWLVVSPPDSVIRWWNPSSRPELRELVAAVGTRRGVEGRLSGGFAWGAVPSPTRGANSPATDTPDVQIAAGHLLQAAERRRTARTLAALGTAHLSLGRFAEAVDTLEQAVVLDPRAAFVWSDLAAARIAHSGAGGSDSDLPRAVEAAERALAIDPAFAEAQFNKAIALERLGQLSQAAEAWRAYLRLDGASAWATEARTRLADLEKRRTSATSPRDLQNLRERLFDDVLPRWAALVLANKSSSAETFADAVAIGERLSTESTDRFSTDVLSPRVRVVRTSGTNLSCKATSSTAVRVRSM